MTAVDSARTSDLYAHLRAGTCHMAVPVADVLRAVELPTGGLTPLPRRQGALAGMMEFDGGIVPVVALERWVTLGDGGPPANARVVVLRSGSALIGIRIDALIGTGRLPAAQIRTVCRDAAAEELFEAIAPATADRPLLCLLEVARLMALACVWCEAADLRPGRSAAVVARRRSTTRRYALFTIGTQLWAVPATAITRLEPKPTVELRFAAQRTCGIGAWGARKVPLVDLGFADRSAPDAGESTRRWMAVLVDGPHAIGLVVDRGERMLDLADDDIVPTPADEVLAGTTMVAGRGLVSVLDVDRLFRAVPEATISRVPTAPTAAAAAAGATGAVAPQDDANSHYLVFEADRPYATPVRGVVGVMALPAAAIDDLTHGRRATIDWRGQTLGVVNLPSIDGGTATTLPRIAVVVEAAGTGTGTGEARGRSAIAIRSLTHWLPARTARRSSMRMPALGDVPVITPPGAPRGGSLVVVDLAQMAYLLA